jgi:hypothetical protein
MKLTIVLVPLVASKKFGFLAPVAGWAANAAGKSVLNGLQGNKKEAPISCAIMGNLWG